MRSFQIYCLYLQMTIKQYSKKAGVSIRTIYNDLKSGRILFNIIVGKRRPVYDIDPLICDPKMYRKDIRRSIGRPKGAKNKLKTKE